MISKLGNNMDQQLQFLLSFRMHQNGPVKPQPYSLLASMYQSWQEYHVPAIYYHYLLSVLPKLQKKQQMLIMAREVKSLKANTHPYHKIINAIQARQRSLEIILQFVSVFIQYQSTEDMEWPQAQNSGNSMQLQFDNYPQNKGTTIGNSYKISHEDPRSPLLSPSLHSPHKQKQSKLHQLLNHLKLYQRLTAQIISMIYQWQQQLLEMGYKESLIQFQYHKQDYLQRINIDTSQILDRYQHIFQNNPFLLIKKMHEKSEFALVYQELRLSQEMIAKLHWCLNVIAGHQAEILKYRMLAKVSQTANRRKIIYRSSDLHKIYKNYNHGQDYIVIKDTQTMKKSKVYHQPVLSKNKNIKNDPEIPEQPSDQTNNRLRSLKNSIIVNPQSRLLTIDRTQRKHPVNSNLLNQMYNNSSNTPQIYLKQKGPPQLAQSRKVRSQKSANLYNNAQMKGLQRSLTQDQIMIKRSSSVMLSQGKKQAKGFGATGAQFRERVQVKPVHRQNQVFVGDRDYNNREDQIDRNKGISAQKKLQMMDKVNSQLKLKNKSYAQVKQQQVQKAQKVLALPLKKPQPIVEENPEPPAQLPQNNDITLTFQQSIRPTQIVKYLREKVFKTSPQMSFQDIQNLAKKILAQKQYITFIRVESKNMNIAWLAVKFMEKDNIMRRSVFVLYVRKFVRLSGFQRKLLEKFVEHGYGMIRNQQKILFQVDLVDIVVRPLLKIKYKVNPTCQKSQLKKLFKKTPTLSQTRILKYHTYSKQSKYHKYCNHQKSHCQISYNFLQLSKITIDRSQYIKCKADKITKLNQGLYRISCIVNETDLIIANTMTDILGLEKQVQIQKDSSFQQHGQEVQYRYLAVKEGKVMRKYVNQADEVLLCQFVTINGNIPQVRSISMNKEEVKDQVLILEPPFFMAIMTRDPGEAKTLAVLEFS